MDIKRLPGYDINGNPRYVVHFVNLLTEQEKSAPYWDEEGRKTTPTKYEIAVRRANKIGGRKYHTKTYGGGIVFQSYSVKELEQSIKDIVEKESSQ